MHALIAVGALRVGDKSFYAGMKETASTCSPTDSVEMVDNTSNNTMDCDTMGDETTNNTIYDEGKQNLDLILNAMDEQDKLKQDVLTLGNAFIEEQNSTAAAQSCLRELTPLSTTLS